MKIYCHGLDLSDAVLKVVKAVPSKKVIPVLEGIKLKAEGNHLTITATDLELVIEKKIVADVKLDGEAVVPGKFFAEFVKKLTSEQIEIDTTEKNVMKIKYMDSKGELQCLNADEFPPIKEVSDEVYFNINQKSFKDILAKTVFSAATDDIRPILKGCLFEIENNVLNVVALDGFRLACAKKQIEASVEKTSFIVSARCLSEISKLLEDEDKNVKVCIGSNCIMVDLDHTKIVSRLMEGEFIQYKKIIPPEFMATAIVNKAQFENGLERASLVSRGDKNNLIKLDVKEKIMTISSSSEIGTIKENVVISLDGKDLSVGFNARYITEAIRATSDGFIKIKFTSSTSPCVITSAESDEFLYLILPVKIIG